jgi:hypothetical protein
MGFAVEEADVQGKKDQQASYEPGPVQPGNLNDREHTK